LHQHGSNNPMGIDRRGPQDSIPFHPYYTVKDMFGLCVFLLFFAIFVFYAPNLLGDPANYIPANPMVTPPHIVPEWYFLPFYAILRSITFDVLGIPGKLIGVVLMFGAVLILFLVPWLDTSPVRSARYRPIYRIVSWFLVAADPSPTPEKDEALRALYGDARVLARSNESQNRTDAAK